MGLGDSRYGSSNNSSNNSNNNGRYDPSYYSGLKIKNYDSKTAIGIVFTSGLMNISIQKEDESTHKYEDIIKASLTGKKALILLHEMDLMEADEAEVTKAYGVTLGLGDVQTAFAFQKVNGTKYMRIAKVNSDGSIKDQKSFEFANGVDSGVQWSDFDRMSFGKDVVDDIDYIMLKNTIEDFSRNLSGAAGYGQIYLNRYDQSSMTNKVNAIMDKLGIERRSNNSNYGSGNNGFFNNANSEHKSMSQYSSMLDDAEE